MESLSGYVVVCYDDFSFGLPLHGVYQTDNDLIVFMCCCLFHFVDLLFYKREVCYDGRNVCEFSNMRPRSGSLLTIITFLKVTISPLNNEV